MIFTEEQRDVFDFAASGHNLVITGRAGTGKSFLVEKIIEYGRKYGRTCALVCPSGVSCTVYEPGVASTIHSYYGLQTCELPWEQLVQRSCDNVMVLDRIKKADLIIWDEASMSSRRTLEIVNALYFKLDEKCRNPFAGKQIITVGDFLQLRPVLSPLDTGDFMFLSPLFQAALHHRFELTHILRQKEDEKTFLKALSDLRIGRCTAETSTYLKSLSRQLSEEDQSKAVHIFFRRLPAELHNQEVLRQLPGNLYRFEATCKGNFKSTVNKVILLKANCAVMLLWNLNDKLKNGSKGVFLGVDDDKLLVRFENEGVVKIKRETWFHRNRKGEVTGSIHQYPIALAYAITCHKSQGLTLEAAVVHCSREFVSGLTYVACSRIKSVTHLQVINFDPSVLLPPSPSIVEELATNIGPTMEDQSCCRHKKLPLSYFKVKEIFHDLDLDCEDELFPQEVACEILVKNYFDKKDGTQNAQDLQYILDLMNRNESRFSCPPDSFDIDKFLQSVVDYIDGELTPREETKIKLLNDFDKATFVSFFNLIWFHCYLLFSKFLLNNNDEVTVISRQSFSAATGELHEFTQSNDYINYIHQLFQVSQVSVEQTTLAFQLTMKIYTSFLEHLSLELASHPIPDTTGTLVTDMPVVGKAKVRHVGGWVIHKLLQSSRNYVRSNMFSMYKETQDRVRNHNGMCEMIEECCIIPFKELEHSTQYNGTLGVTESRQYRERGLIHITDHMFEFFMMVEQKRVNVINEKRLTMLKDELVEQSKKDVLSDEQVKKKWVDSFKVDSELGQNTYKNENIDHLFKEAVGYYINMGASQFLRDYRRAHSIKKSIELRKKVLQKQRKAEERKESVPFQEIQKDRGPGKVGSHGRLLNFVRKFNSAGLVRAYTKAELLSLSVGYGLQPRRASSKLILAKDLEQVVLCSLRIPYPYLIDDRQYTVTQMGNMRVRLSLR